MIIRYSPPNLQALFCNSKNVAAPTPINLTNINIFELIVYGIYDILLMMNKVEYRNILIVEDNDALRDSLVEYFSAANNVTACPSLTDAKAAAHNGAFDVVLLDLILPDGNGVELLELLGKTPVVILSDLGSDMNIIEGFSAGAADYIVKPCSPRVIEARMALRLLPDASSKICLHELSLDISTRTAIYKGTRLDLTSSEFNILMFLMQNAGEFYTANDIYEKVWKMPHLNSMTIKTHISNLRKKMFSVSKECADLILTEFGKGYAFIGGK